MSAKYPNLTVAVQLLPDNVVDGFEASWSDGYLLALLVEAVGGPVCSSKLTEAVTIAEAKKIPSLCITSEEQPYEMNPYSI